MEVGEWRVSGHIREAHWSREGPRLALKLVSTFKDVSTLFKREGASPKESVSFLGMSVEECGECV
jgi:hypothetical protein